MEYTVTRRMQFKQGLVFLYCDCLLLVFSALPCPHPLITVYSCFLLVVLFGLISQCIYAMCSFRGVVTACSNSRALYFAFLALTLFLSFLGFLFCCFSNFCCLVWSVSAVLWFSLQITNGSKSQCIILSFFCKGTLDTYWTCCSTAKRFPTIILNTDLTNLQSQILM